MKKETNYRKWSFKFLIYIILLNFLVAFMVYKVMMETTLIIQLEGYEKPENYNLIYIQILNILISLLFIAGLVLTILSIKNREVKDYKYKTSIYGYSIFIILTILINLYRFF
jgi:hypothetical protein